jgi:hypothetical protein
MPWGIARNVRDERQLMASSVGSWGGAEDGDGGALQTLKMKNNLARFNVWNS